MRNPWLIEDAESFQGSVVYIVTFTDCKIEKDDMRVFDDYDTAKEFANYIEREKYAYFNWGRKIAEEIKTERFRDISIHVGTVLHSVIQGLESVGITGEEIR